MKVKESNKNSKSTLNQNTTAILIKDRHQINWYANGYHKSEEGVIYVPGNEYPIQKAFQSQRDNFNYFKKKSSQNPFKKPDQKLFEKSNEESVYSEALGPEWY